MHRKSLIEWEVNLMIDEMFFESFLTKKKLIHHSKKLQNNFFMFTINYYKYKVEHESLSFMNGYEK